MLKKASEVMNKKVRTVNRALSLRELSQLLLEEKISGVPVVDKNGVLIGMVTETDILNIELEPEMPLYFDPLFTFGYFEFVRKYESDIKDYMDTKTVGDVMKRRVLSVKEDDTTDLVTEIMVSKNINRLPVVDKEGRVVGIITRSDLLRSMTKDKGTHP